METREKICQIFNYMLAVKDLSQKPVININQYDKVWFEKDLPKCDGCFLNGTGLYKDAWLEVHKVDIPPVPELPVSLKDWVVNFDNPQNKPEIVNKIERKSDVSWESFEDDRTRVKDYESFLEGPWRSWAHDAALKKKVQALYNDMFALHQKLQRESDDIEIAWGHGILNWKVDGNVIKRPLCVTPLELKFDAKNGAFFMVPTIKGTVMETDMLNDVKIPYDNKLQDVKRRFESEEFDVRSEEDVRPIFEEIVNIIDPEGKYTNDDLSISKDFSHPLISYSPLIFLRKKSGRIWDSELTNCVESIKSGYKVPDFIKLLVEGENESTENTNDSQNNTDPEWDKVGEKILFPLPSNEEQKLIVKKLSKNCGVVVQGPPGTGKSHTIANLICHLLAHGKRVLVTSEKERPLRVLRDKIPKEIRPFCVAMLGGDSDSIKDMENSIRNIAECIDSYDPDMLKKDIEYLEGELYKTEKKIAEIKNMLNEAGKIENKAVNIDGEDMTPLEIGKWLRENPEYNWIVDPIKNGTQCPISDSELEVLFSLIDKLTYDDLESLKKHRIKSEDIPSPIEFKTKVEELKKLEDEFKNVSCYIENWGTVNDISYDNLDKCSRMVLNIIDNLKTLNEPWQKFILEDSIYGKDKYDFWNEIIDETKGRLQKIDELDRELMEYEIDFPENINQSPAKEDLIALKHKLHGDEKIGWVLKNITGRKFSYLLEGIKINGIAIRKLSDVEIAIKFFTRNEIKKKIELKWNNAVDEIEGPKIDILSKRYSVNLREYLSKLEKSLKWSDEFIAPVKDFIESLKIPETPKWTDIEWFKKVYNGITALKMKKQLENVQVFFEGLRIKLIKQGEALNSHESFTELLKAVDEKNTELWDRTYMEIIRLEGLDKDYAALISLQDKLCFVCPKFTQNIADICKSKVNTLSDFKRAWKWSECNFYINEISKKTDIEGIEGSLKGEDKSKSRILKELVSKSTWLSQIERTTSTQKRSLFAWMKAVQRMGKGTGKYTDMYRKEAKNEMKNCKDAVPVWIMPIQKIIENIELSDNLFDVIIVDESSQSNLLSLCALLRAKKAVIVGDDNQISPESVGTDIGKVSKLIKRYLGGIPQAARFETKTSLYDIASEVLESKILLKEHFRCVPEIIQFSNDLMYDGKMIPLRLPMSEDTFDPPVCDVFVENGFRDENTTKVINRPEAEAIVDKIKKCCSDPKYEGKTIGVISLQGHDESNLIEELLRDAIGEAEMIKRKLICGDAYYFQGDERDIIFLSMVAAPNMRIMALNKRSDYQRFNVASSRAKDQMFLYHSVKLDGLNPECVRYKLLQYCEDPHRVQKKVQEVDDLFESQFERDVFKIITAYGYRVIPQVKVGTLGKRIDMVVEGVRNRLAVECDGDKWHGIDRWEDDLERQRILERVGWTFWRVRGSSFYRDPQKAMEPLWDKLNEMGI